MVNIGSCSVVMLDGATKGIPAETAPFLIGEIGQKGWNLLAEDLPLPLAVLRQDDIAHNSRWMRDFLHASGAQIAPHGKTTMSPDLFNLQIEDGAWGITLATVQQVKVARKYGHRRILLANQLVGRAAIDGIFGELKADPAFEFFCIADSVANVRALARAAAEWHLSRPLRILVELGYPGGRTGCRTIEEALRVAQEIAGSGGRLSLAGVEAFEGLLRGTTASETRELVEAFLARLLDLAAQCDAAGLYGSGRPILSAGGSAYYDIVVDKLQRHALNSRYTLLLRSGCYLTHDSGMYRRAFEQLRTRNPALAAWSGGLRPALEIWAYIQSRAEPSKAIANFGKRDASHDDLPVAIKWFRPGGSMSQPERIPCGHRVIQLNDQHCHLEIAADSPLAVGDMVAFGISHPCLTFDKWRTLYVVDENYTVVSAVCTYF
ncbi:amino acid deaminase [Chelatococcus asaccharovorans]|uniref:amino acid deaminase n=1 Tax=Chelatococcus asaccharovorans TaxID=28210 RepID=UPI00224C65DC|nr:amino acid deaminase [Chelatococcus asaccharovorans]CAH1669123.1 D-serine deaminase [Chelatococcus asaccharovorans]CAH1679456.1 D-serine deaminase [Chelatococcus asaccharovorans]